MFKQHQLRQFEVNLWPAPDPIPYDPPIGFIKGRITQSLSTDNVLKNMPGWSNSQVNIDKISLTTANQLLIQVDGQDVVGEIILTIATICLIRDEWQLEYARSHSYPLSHFVPPKIPLKCFTHRLRMENGTTTVDVEIYPGVDSW